jgi:ferredoxin
MGRDKYVIDGKEYDECAFCRASCPSREDFKEPDSGLPLKCDMCEGEDEPLCVKWCITDALVLEEREEDVEEVEVTGGTGARAGSSLADKHGLQKIIDTVARMSKAKKDRIKKPVETVADYKEIVDEIKANGGEAFTRCYQCGLCDAVCPWNRVIRFSMRKIVRAGHLRYDGYRK